MKKTKIGKNTYALIKEKELYGYILTIGEDKKVFEPKAKTLYNKEQLKEIIDAL